MIEYAWTALTASDLDTFIGCRVSGRSGRDRTVSYLQVLADEDGEKRSIASMALALSAGSSKVRKSSRTPKQRDNKSFDVDVLKYKGPGSVRDL